MRKSLRLALAGALAVAGAGPVLAQWTGSWSPVEPGDPVAYAPGGAVPEALLKRTRKTDIHAATKRVVIPFFQLQVVNASKATANRAYASASMSYVLNGVTGDQLQALADNLYAQFVRDLADKGFTVVPLEEAKTQSPALAKLLAAAKPAPFAGKTADGNISAIYTSGGTPIYFHINDPQMGSMANIGSRAYWDQPAAAKELNAAMVGVRLGVTFVHVEANNKRGFMGYRSSRAKVTGDVGLSIMPITTHMWIHSPSQTSGIVGQPIDPVRYYLTSGLELPDDAILSVDDATTRGQRMGDALTSAFGALSSYFNGFGFDSKTKAYRVRVDPKGFDSEVGGALRAVEATFADRVAADL